MGRGLDVAKGFFKMQVHRRRVYRVGIQNHQPVDLTCPHVIDQGDNFLRPESTA